MPNWCENTTFVYGKTEDVKEFVDPVFEAMHKDENGNVSFMDVHVPCPEELVNHSASVFDLDNPVNPIWKTFVNDGTWTKEFYEEQCTRALAEAAISKSNVEKYGFPSWYEWRIHHWGTKWGDCHTNISLRVINEKTSEVTIQYDTAWSPIDSGFIKLSEMFPKLIFTTYYREPGMGFQGVYQVANGEVIMDQSGDIIPTADDYEYMMDCADETWVEAILNGTERAEF